MNKIFTLITVLFLAFNAAVFGDNTMLFKNIDNKQGLSQNGVVSMFQDKGGYMWLGTNYGLNRYDGVRIKSYYRGNSYNDLCGNMILSILQDSVGNIWIATIEGISVFNPVSEKFYNLSKYISNSNDVCSHTILSMRLIDNEIFASSNEGLWRINPGSKLFNDEVAKVFCASDSRQKVIPYIKLTSIKIYSKDKHNNYWITANNHVMSTKIIKNRLLVIDDIKLNEFNEEEINVIYRDNFANIWAGTKGQGLYKIFEVKGKYNVAKINPDKNITFSIVSDIYQDKQSDLWISTRSEGMFRLPKNELQKNNCTPIKFTNHNILSSNIRCFYKSHDNTFWIGTLGNGVFAHNAQGLKFKNYQLSKDVSNSSINYTRTITKDSYNRLWFGTLFKGLYVFDQNNQKIIKSLMPEKSIFALTVIDNAHYLIGASDGLYLASYTKDAFKVDKMNTNNLINGTVFSICKHANNIWIGSSIGFISFTLTNDYKINNIVKYKNKLLSDTKSQNTIRIVTYDGKTNSVWIGGETSGLVRAQLNENGEINKFIAITNNNKTSIAKYICDIHIGNNNYWIGSRNGLIHLKITESSKYKAAIYTTQNGLPSNLVQSVRSDKSGNLWLGTIRGLVRFNKKTHEYINYNAQDGIQDLEFSEHSAFVDTDGTMYFGGINGVSAFIPRNLHTDHFVEPVIISELYVNGNNANERRESFDSKGLKLSYSENNIKIHFISNNYINPSKCKYAYMLEGVDNDWVYTTADKKWAEYLSLPSGKYTFKVKASNEDGIWMTNHTNFYFEVKPSFWLSFPGLLLLALIFAGLVYLLKFYIEKREREKSRKLLKKQFHEQNEKINQAKLQFFINISHEIRTPLTLILCSIENLIQNLKFNKEQEKEVGIIDKNVNRILKLSNELLEIRKIETGKYQLNVQEGDIVGFVKDITLTFESLALKQGIELTMESDTASIQLWFDANALEKIISNLITNALKYTKRDGTILIKINSLQNKDFLEISVVDNGIGIEKENLTKIFDHFYHLGGNKDSYENGFGIGLFLIKNLIELHKGTISVSSELHKGSVFTITIPTNDAIFTNDEKADKVLWSAERPTILSRHENGDDMVQEIEEESSNKGEGEFVESKPTVLYVDDNVELLENISSYLADSYTVLLAQNGQIGFEMANEHQPDVIISDVVMPVMDGLELCYKLKNDINTSHIPVILLTARGDSDSQYQGIESGADHFIPKPFNIKLLSLTIKNLIESREKLRMLFQNSKYEEVPEITTNSKDKDFMDKLLKYVDEHIGEDELNIQSIADNFSMSRSTFFRKIKAITGATGKDFIDTIRLKKAMKLLIGSDLNISEVAYDTGFSSPQYFTKWFKLQCQMSPTEYIAKHKK